jgi:protein-L-isoaspartate(D-aspartate) O-methyltransferase
MNPQPSADPYEMHRLAMVELQLRQRGIHDERVLAAMALVLRHEFVPGERVGQSYEDQPIEIGAGQTISQPYIVAAMLDALKLAPTDRVLEIGTGSGYQTALLSRLASQVYTVERHETLLNGARERLLRLGFTNIEFIVADGSRGLPGKAPFNAIIVSAAAPRIPAPLTDQLAEGGRLVLPVGAIDAQELQLVRKSGGQLSIQRLDGCRFVPLIGREGFPSEND